MPAVTFSEAAAALGHKSRSWLYRARDDGRLSGYLRPGGKGGAQLLELEPEGLPTLREWVAGVLRVQANSPAAAASPPPGPAAADPADVALGLAQLVAGLPEDAIPALNVSRERREHYDAERARLQALQLRGDLVAADDVRQEAAQLGRLVRDRIMGLPARIAPLLAAEITVAGAQRLLAAELRQALAVLAAEGTGADD